MDGKRNVAIALGGVAVIGVAARLVSRTSVAEPPIRHVVHVVNGSASAVSVSAGGAPLEPVPAGGSRRYALRAGKSEPIAFAVERAGATPVRCSLAPGVHVVNASSDVVVRAQDVTYVKEGSTWIPAGREHVWGVGCHLLAEDVGVVVYGVDEEPPARVESSRDPKLPFAVETRIKLRREAPR